MINLTISGNRRRVTAVVAPLHRLGMAVCALSVATGAAAQAPEEAAIATRCRVPDQTALIDAPLPRLAKRLKAPGAVTVVVIGSGSAAGSGTSGRDAAFPQRLEGRLARAYPKATVRLITLAKTGQTAPAMYARFAREVMPLKPALVIWQTGSADIAGGVQVTEFESALEHGIADLHASGSDVLLVDGQFSPRGSLMINTDAYRDAVRWNARHFDVPFFRRYDTMQYWWDNQVFDLDAQDRAGQLETADRIHDCVAVLLMRAIGHGVAEVRS